MYVCICKGITEEELKGLSQTGMAPREILKKLGVGDSCGICLIEALEGLQAAAPQAHQD